jgi:hypothetical protein
MPVGRAVDDLEIVLKLSDNFDWATPILYLPLWPYQCSSCRSSMRRK